MTITTSRRTAAAVVALLVAAACVPPPPTNPVDLQAEADAPCGASHNACSLPFPSEAWQVADPSTPTGLAVVPPANLLDPRLLSQLGPAATMDDAFRSSDGFSPMSPIFFQFPAGIDPLSIPPGGGEIVRVFDVTTGRRVAARVEVSQLQVDDRNQRGVLGIWPVTRWEPGHRMVAIVSPGLMTTGGVALPRIRRVPGGFRQTSRFWSTRASPRSPGRSILRPRSTPTSRPPRSPSAARTAPPLRPTPWRKWCAPPTIR